MRIRMIGVLLYVLVVSEVGRVRAQEPYLQKCEVCRLWPSQPPPGCPFPKSGDLAGIVFTGRHNEYENADTWYPSWASDGNLYSPYTDGIVGGVQSNSLGRKATTGQAKIEGDDPLYLKVSSLGSQVGSAAPYGGRYPSASLVYNGVWYYGTYALDDLYWGDQDCSWCTMGPFVGFRLSHDKGKSWVDCPRTPDNNLFGESSKGGGKIKMGAPHFVDFGQNMEHSPDGNAYLVAHGATRRDASESWIDGDQIYMARVKPSPDTINDPSKYEFFAGYDEGNRPKWSGSFADIRPLVEWNGHMGIVTMTYDPPLKRFLMCIADGRGRGTYNTYILESDQVAGPWSLVTYMQKFGEQGYFVNIPSKFISRDGRTAWLCFSHNWTRDQKTNPPGGRYGLCLQEIKLPQGTTEGIPPMEPVPVR